jgi:hypothetical protein
MKIKGWEKISGYTYKGYAIVNPIHNADETKYFATILDLNDPTKPKWELSVLTPAHKFKISDTFSVILKDDEGRSRINEHSKEMMSSKQNFRMIFEEMIDGMLKTRLISAPMYSSHSLQTITPKPMGGIIGQVNNSGTFSIYDASTGTSIDLVDTIKGLQKQIEDLKLQQNGGN